MRYKNLGVFSYIKLNTAIQRGEVLGQLMINRLRHFFMSKNKKKGMRKMSKLFMYGTTLEGIEQLMTLVPNFEPRESGIVINNYFNCEGGVKDCNCNVISVSNECDNCGYTNSNLKFNVDKLEYKDLIKDSFGKLNNYTLKSRLKLLSIKFKGEIFLNHSHKERFYNSILKQKIDIEELSPRDIAILFLFTADETLWKLSEDAVGLNGFDFNKICLRQISIGSYALYQTAKTISTGKEHIKVNEIADRDLIDDTTFKAIINASLIVRYGADVFSITK